MAPRDFLRELATLGLVREQRRKAPERWVLDVYPGLRDVAVDMGEITYSQSGMGPYEQYVLCGLASLIQPGRIFEIGTFEGATTLLLARAAPSAEVLTLDLAPGIPIAAEVAHEREAVNSARIGVRFRDAGESGRIVQLLGDSTTFDFSPWFDSCDLVLVDGSHAREAVASDTANAMNLIHDSGTIIWDDYLPGWPGVVAAVDELRDRRIVHLANTTLAVLVPD